MGIISSNSLDIKVKVANLYYYQNLSQQEIAKLLNISRTTVSRILKSCIEEGIVSIHIKNTSTYQYELEKKLRQKYKLKHVSVVSDKNDSELILKTIGDSTSDYLKEVIDSNVRIGVSAGTTIAGIIPQLRPISSYSIDVVQMSGDASHQMSNCASVLTIEVAKALGGMPHAMHVPLLVHTKVLRDLLLEEPFNKKHFQELDNLDIAIVGLGLLDDLLPGTSDTWYNFVADKEELRKKKAVGDICGVFIDKDGNICDADIQDRTISISLNKLRDIKECIAVAFGRKKKYITQAAIKGLFVNVLIIDEELARALLEDSE
ncbi:sugar-binding transcriptional regulator [Mediterraneibacter massiliensis]|uniref:sugar-binding transcriptional regulator n=1 Tax=Mediterraneibacter massiliensis TaxID=1720300 RepID=UPI0024ACDDFE|nr:sugar-binding domain-containing protein [Mediterraneibacter massiliensis]